MGFFLPPTFKWVPILASRIHPFESSTHLSGRALCKGREGLLANSTVTQSKKNGFGSSALTIDGRIFATLNHQGKLLVKLPKQRVDALVASGEGERFDSGRGRLMKEWATIEPASGELWLPLAREAMKFVASKP